MMRNNLEYPGEKDKKNEFLNSLPKGGNLRKDLGRYFINNSADWFKFKEEFSKIMRWGGFERGYSTTRIKF